MDIKLTAGTNTLKFGSKKFNIVKAASSNNWDKIKAIDGSYAEFAIDSANTSYGMPALTSLTHMYLMNSDSIFLNKCKSNLKMLDINITNLTNLDSVFAGSQSLSSCSFGWGDGVTSATQCFAGCQSLTGFVCGNMGMLQTATSMFEGCSNVTTINVNFQLKEASRFAMLCQKMTYADIGTVENAKNYSLMFGGCSSLEKIEAYSITDKTSLENAESMFGGCTRLIGLGDFSGITFSKLSNAKGMFNGCLSLSSISLNMPALTVASGMFSSCTSLTSAEMGEISGDCDVTEMFASCVDLKTIKLNMPKVKNLGVLFHKKVIPLRDFTMVSCTGCITASSMFEDYTYTSGITLGSMPSLKYADRMFRNCTSLSSITITNLSSVLTTDHMFFGCTKLTGLSIGTMPNVTSSQYMFYNCNKLKEIHSAQFFATGITDASYMMAKCSALTYMSVSWTNLQTADYMMSGCSSITGFGGVQKATLLESANYMFYGCSSLQAIDGRYASLKNAYYMFYGCSSLSTVTQDQSTGFKNLEDARYMFAGCSSLVNMYFHNVDSADYTKPKQCVGMFSGCSSIGTIAYLDLSRCTDYSHMFDGCTSLTTLVLSGINQSLDLSYSPSLGGWGINQTYSMAQTVSNGKTITFNTALKNSALSGYTEAFKNKGWTVAYRTR